MPKTKTGKKKGKRKIAGRKIAGKEGTATQYLTRNQAIQRLQVSLPDFRRLCILKGVYPREPKKKIHGKNKTYYYTKDILFLSHETILKTFRDLKAFLKKFKKAKVKDDLVRVAKLEEVRPTYSLAHIVRERYPTFIDSLRDLDDALCMIVLFSTLPSNDNLVSTRVKNCERLQKELQAYMMRKGCLKKMFLSIKGIYYQAEVMGQKVTWIAPFKFKQTVPLDVDMRVMLTFLEFYEVLLHFTNYKLYNSEGLSYPPDIEQVFANSVEALAKEKRGSADDDENVDAYDDVDVPIAGDEEKKLLADCYFYLSRETPKEALFFIIKNFGGRVAYEGDASGVEPGSSEITHHVVDRPTQHETFPNREYVQPQWVVDSCNNGVLLPTFEYAPGKELPAHLSPFVDDDTEGYIPKRKEYLQRVKGEAMGEDGEEEDEEEEIEGDEEDEEEGEEEEDEEEEIEGDEEDDISGDEKEEEVPVPAAKKKKTVTKVKVTKPEDDQRALASGLMSRKTRKMYTNIKRAEQKKSGNVEELKRKRQVVEEKEAKRRKK